MMKPEIHERGNDEQVELGEQFSPKFDDEGRIPAIVIDHQRNDVLMMAWMNRDALEQTLESGYATYYRRSRKKIWVKGEHSGRRQRVREIRVDCDQDVLLLRVEMEKEGACHRGYRSCFYRKISSTEEGKLEFQDEPPLFDPERVYRNSE